MSSPKLPQHQGRAIRSSRLGVRQPSPRSQPLEPIWARSEPGARQPRFSREQIAQVALAIADAEGFEAVSMRRIAKELRSGTMTLYHYLETKDDLKDLLHDAILAEAIVPQDHFPSDWRGALTAIAGRTRSALLAHPWSLMALQGAIPGPNAFRHIDQSLAALAATSLTEEQKTELLAFVDDYVAGYVLHLVEVLAIGPRQRERGLAGERWAREELRTGSYPHLPPLPDATGLADTWDELAARLTDDARFERGLSALLDGAAQQYDLKG